jgi:hypothetical protein
MPPDTPFQLISATYVSESPDLPLVERRGNMGSFEAEAACKFSWIDEF